METSIQIAIGIATLVVVAVAAFTLYWLQQRKRVLIVGVWVRSDLQKRYGAVPDELHVNCSDDQMWPVLVDFIEPTTRTRHKLQFTCHGPASSWCASK